MLHATTRSQHVSDEGEQHPAERVPIHQICELYPPPPHLHFQNLFAIKDYCCHLCDDGVEILVWTAYVTNNKDGLVKGAHAAIRCPAAFRPLALQKGIARTLPQYLGRLCIIYSLLAKWKQYSDFPLLQITNELCYR
jgi:hypothetical protein